MSLEKARNSGVLSEEELEIKVRLEKSSELVFCGREHYNSAIRRASAEIRKYDGELRNYFDKSLEGLRNDRREFFCK